MRMVSVGSDGSDGLLKDLRQFAHPLNPSNNFTYPPLARCTLLCNIPHTTEDRTPQAILSDSRAYSCATTVTTRLPSKGVDSGGAARARAPLIIRMGGA